MLQARNWLNMEESHTALYRLDVLGLQAVSHLQILNLRLVLYLLNRISTVALPYRQIDARIPLHIYLGRLGNALVCPSSKFTSFRPRNSQIASDD